MLDTVSFLQLTAIIVDDSDPAIAFFVDAVGFELAVGNQVAGRVGYFSGDLEGHPPGASGRGGGTT